MHAIANLISLQDQVRLLKPALALRAPIEATSLSSSLMSVFCLADSARRSARALFCSDAVCCACCRLSCTAAKGDLESTSAILRHAHDCNLEYARL